MIDVVIGIDELCLIGQVGLAVDYGKKRELTYRKSLCCQRKITESMSGASNAVSELVRKVGEYVKVWNI